MMMMMIIFFKSYKDMSFLDHFSSFGLIFSSLTGFCKRKLFSALHFVVFEMIYMNFSLATEFATMKIINFFVYNSNLYYNNETDSLLRERDYETVKTYSCNDFSMKFESQYFSHRYC